jgi:hypothetical protein
MIEHRKKPSLNKINAVDKNVAAKAPRIHKDQQEMTWMRDADGVTCAGLVDYSWYCNRHKCVLELKSCLLN